MNKKSSYMTLHNVSDSLVYKGLELYFHILKLLKCM